MKFRFNIKFLKGPHVVAELRGQRELLPDEVTVEEMARFIPTTEAFLEKLTGLRVHIEQVA